MTNHDHKPPSPLLRLAQWPTSFFVGIIIGIAVVWIASNDIEKHLNPTGIHLFSGAWIMLIGTGYTSSVGKVLDSSPPSKLQKFTIRAATIIGITLSSIAFVFFKAQPLIP